MIDKIEDKISTHNFQDCQTSYCDNPTVEKLAECHQYLEVSSCQVQAEIRASFDRLVNALRSREKQLLRQVDVFQSQQIASLQSSSRKYDEMSTLSPLTDIQVNLEDEEALLERISSYGKVTVKGDNCAVIDQLSNVYRVEEYQSMKEDHMNLFKPVSEEQNTIKFVLASNSRCISQSKNKITANQSSLTQQIDIENNLKDDQHTPPIHEWLQQIKTETEIEPTVGEVEKEISPQDE